MSDLISSRDKKRAKMILAEMKRLSAHRDPRDVAALLSKTPSVAASVPGLQATVRSNIARVAMKEYDKKFNTSESRKRPLGSGKKFRKLRKTRRHKQKRRRMTHRR